LKCSNCGFENPKYEKYCINCHELLDAESKNHDQLPNRSFLKFLPIIGFVICIVFLFAFGVISFPEGSSNQGHNEVAEYLTTIEAQETQQKFLYETTAEEKDFSEENETQEPKSTKQPETSPSYNSEDPAPGKIVFTCQIDRQTNHDQICIINPDGTGWKQLTNDLHYEHYYASFSANGDQIVFSSSLPDHTGFNIFIMNSDGSDMTQITSGMGDFYAPALSPDGQYLVATRHINSNNYISLLTRDGDFIKDLNSYYDCKDPVWSPDGQQILFAADPDKTGIQFYIMNKDGSNVRKLTDMDGLRGRSDWSIDGIMASYTGEYSLHNRELFLFGENGSTQIITEGGDNLAPSFSPDGKWITFMSYRDNYWDPDGCEIYIMRLSDGYTRRLTDNNYCDYQPRWGN